jgi:glutamate-ammonia-ligase adenylyltransferase
MRNPEQFTDFDSLVRHAAHCSRYFARLLDAEPGWLDTLRADHRTPADADLIARWLQQLPAADEAQLARALRVLRKRVMLHLILRDLGGLCALEEVMAAMTALAELAVQRCSARSH